LRRRRKASPAVENDAVGAAPDVAAQQSAIPRWALPLAAAVLLIVSATLGWRWWHAAPVSGPTASLNAEVRPSQPVTLPTPVNIPEPAATPENERLETPALLARAGKYLEDGMKSGLGEKFGYPAGDNAIDLFREVLRREPGNAAATQGLTRIAAFYERGARSALQRGLDTGADELIEKGLRAAPGDAALLKLRAELNAHVSAQGG